MAPATHSAAELLAAQSEILAKARGFAGGVGVSVNFATNGLTVKVKDRAAFEAHLKQAGYSAAPSLAFIAGEPGITDQSRVVGGRDISGCQTGFVVASYSGQRGVSSAEHCSEGPNTPIEDAQTNEVLGTRVQGLLDNATGTDVNWYTTASHTYAPYIHTATGEIRISSSKGLSLMPAGTDVCISRTQPATSTVPAPGVVCGKVYNPNYTITNASTGAKSGPWVAVTWSSSLPKTYGGDSGGPWFYGNAAMGIHKGVDGNLSVFTPVERLSKVGVYVATN